MEGILEVSEMSSPSPLKDEAVKAPTMANVS